MLLGATVVWAGLVAMVVMVLVGVADCGAWMVVVRWFWVGGMIVVAGCGWWLVVVSGCWWVMMMMRT